MNFITYVKTKTTLIGWLIGAGIVMTYFTCHSCHTNLYRYFAVSSYTASIWIAMWLGNEYITHQLDERVLWTQRPVLRLVVGVIAVFVYSFGAAYLLSKIFEALFGFDVGGSWDLSFTVIISFIITLFMTSRSFLFNWRQSAIDAEKLQKESIAAKYESLKNQVNPHFLFNSFNALSNLVHEDPDKAVKFIKQLSDVYRYVLDTREREVVTLDEELKFLESYIYLQKIRFAEKLNIDISLTDRGQVIAPLALQILIENAIKHNVVSADDPLFIRLYSDGDYIAVENNLQKKSLPGGSSAGVGLENICRRYEFLSEKKVEIMEDEHRFVVKLPALRAVAL
jgi:hypothetical protein